MPCECLCKANEGTYAKGRNVVSCTSWLGFCFPLVRVMVQRHSVRALKAGDKYTAH